MKTGAARDEPAGTWSVREDSPREGDGCLIFGTCRAAVRSFTFFFSPARRRVPSRFVYFSSRRLSSDDAPRHQSSLCEESPEEVLHQHRERAEDQAVDESGWRTSRSAWWSWRWRRLGGVVGGGCGRVRRRPSPRLERPTLGRARGVLVLLPRGRRRGVSSVAGLAVAGAVVSFSAVAPAPLVPSPLPAKPPRGA